VFAAANSSGGTQPGSALPARRTLIAVWVGLALALAVMLVVARGAQGPLDDPDPALQRPGFLDVGALPEPAPPVTASVPRIGRPAVIFFERPGRLATLCQALSRHRLQTRADVAVVVAGSRGDCARGVPIVTDENARLARWYGLREPNDRGVPVGYAVVDDQRRIRYRTLDPTVDDELDEVDTILQAAA
jgi:hypothetical protein